ncbi:MAG: ankyrin repeat domain-containing protein [Deltaproteobacteria bacterium]|nr:ankyrin repeat domain-containing protein [Deltaproteobacteria bacterium]
MKADSTNRLSGENKANLFKLLLAKGADIDAVNTEGMTALMHAAAAYGEDRHLKRLTY